MCDDMTKEREGIGGKRVEEKEVRMTRHARNLQILVSKFLGVRKLAPKM